MLKIVLVLMFIAAAHGSACGRRITPSLPKENELARLPKGWVIIKGENRAVPRRLEDIIDTEVEKYQRCKNITVGGKKIKFCTLFYHPESTY